MSKIAFFIPYHTGYAHSNLVEAFASYSSDVHVFIYNWNPQKKMIQDYFRTTNKNIFVHDFNLDTLFTQVSLTTIPVVIILTASLNYLFGKIQLKIFNLIKNNVSSIIDIYAVGHCMFGCQSCAYEHTHRLPITFTNYMLTKNERKEDSDKSNQILICPSYSFEQAQTSLLSNNVIVDYIISFQFPYTIKFHPLTYDCWYDNNKEHPFLSLTELEKQNTERLIQSSSAKIIPINEKNTLKLIELADLIICDSNSSIPFETLYFQNKFIFVYETYQYPISNNNDKNFQTYFHVFHHRYELETLIEQYLNKTLECKTMNSREYFLSKYDTPDGNEIEKLARIRKWDTVNPKTNDTNISVDDIKLQLKGQFDSTPTGMYALGEYTLAEVLHSFTIDDEFKSLLQNSEQL
ncbi:unnamed protein product [Didymodactylos carnosus]|uniref:Uncharacterized protein n=1 Tax=Didymodactylos carnosus TaxID=1234261 RepID=A0A813PYY0_9BILA|nr:unnamed protein product [Didymodactylos carnosus]CAF0839319.1 unnamed protein product [Didymodactylos carnosus]CAF3538623.1 unnamed protein product [Didymodactylos carnosus]CAF3624167.1 unnamed protein product [Didymodactylos carnosus]